MLLRVLIAVLLLPVVALAQQRTIIDLNPGWRFILEKDVAGGQWQDVSLPHTWNALDGADGGGNYYRGMGIYEKHLDLSKHPELAGKSLFIHFDGACSATELYVNDKLAGAPHKGIFGAFTYDVTKLLNLTGDNLLRVRVTNAPDPAIPPLAGDFTCYGGIYRPMQLIATDPLCISPLDDGSSGVYVKQHDVSAQSADLSIATEVRNSSGKSSSLMVMAHVLDDKGVSVGDVGSDNVTVTGDGTDVIKSELTLHNPHLWNGRKDPYLYSVQVNLYDGQRLADQVTVPLGVRFFSADPDRGFILNGSSYPLHGVNRHQDRKDKGWAISDADHAEDFGMIMEMGCTGIRLAHYEHSQTFYDLCDHGGMVVWAELAMVNLVENTPEFDANAQQQLRELIKQNYNHPSICFWSMFNELRPTAAQQPFYLSQVQRLNTLAHNLDPSRLTTAASHLVDSQPLGQVTDVIGFNRYFGWYNGSEKDWPTQLDKLHADLPGRAIAISEYGAGASIRQHEADPTHPVTTSHWHPEEWQMTVHEAAYGAMKDRPWLWGTFLWNMFDFGSDGRSEGDQPGINDKGLVSYDRKTKKDAFYFYKANWSDEKFVYITDRRFSPRSMTTLPVKIYSNCDSVELTLNGKSAGSQGSADHIFVFRDVSLQPGENQLVARSVVNGKSVEDSCNIVVDPSAATRQSN